MTRERLDEKAAYYPPQVRRREVCTECGGESLSVGLCCDCLLDAARDGRPVTVREIVASSLLFVAFAALAIYGLAVQGW